MVLADIFDLSLHLGNFFSLSIQIGAGTSFADILETTVQLGGYPPIHYNLLDLLIMLAISVIAAVLVEKLAGQSTPGGLLGAFLIALIGVWLFTTFIPLVWKGDIVIPSSNVHLITSFIGAVVSIEVVHFFKKAFQKKGKPAAAKA
jgi:uncharacterized membrane protein YeaQ/YmgE (transglycosylase-associated protein family)